MYLNEGTFTSYWVRMKIVIFLKINNHGAASKILLHTEEIPKTFRGQMMQVEWNVGSWLGLAQ